MAKKKKKHIRWSGVALLATFFCAIGFCVYMLVSWLVGLIFPGTSFSGEEAEYPEHAVEFVDPALLLRDSVMAERIDSLVHRTVHLPDTSRFGIDVYDLTSGNHVYGNHEYEMFIPASCMKIPTAVAAYELLGGDHQYHTTLEISGRLNRDTLYGEVLLNAADDPMIMSLDSLAICLYQAGVHAVKGKLVVNATREDTLTSHPSTMAWDIRFARTPLMLRGKKHIMEQLRGSMARVGVGYIPEKQDEDNNTPSSGSWTQVAEIKTPLTDVLAPMLIHSSNVKAEAVFCHADIVKGYTKDRRMHWDQPHVITDYWTKLLCVASRFLGLDDAHHTDGMALLDGSGLSPKNQLSPNLLVQILQHAWKNAPLRQFLLDEGLASPGSPRRGSLSGRMSAERYRDRIFVKTGTLTTQGVTSLSGYIRDIDDHWYAFSIINNNCPVAEGRLFQDEFCSLFVK